jgi:hypothetical protein
MDQYNQSQNIDSGPEITSPYKIANQPSSNPKLAATRNYTAATIVLQWLTYAFWGWTVLVLSILSVMTINKIVNPNDSHTSIPYLVATVLVLLPISIVCDFLYQKHDNDKKIGAPMVVMTFHSVMFALIAIGSLIVTVISALTSITRSWDRSSSLVAMYYSATFIRTLNPPKLLWVRNAYMSFITACILIVILISII